MTNNSLVANVSGAEAKAIATKSGTLFGVNFFNSGTDTLTLYDNATEASGTILFYIKGTSGTVTIPNVSFKYGIWAVQTGSSSKASIYYIG